MMFRRFYLAMKSIFESDLDMFEDPEARLERTIKEMRHWLAENREQMLRLLQGVKETESRILALEKEADAAESAGQTERAAGLWTEAKRLLTSVETSLEQVEAAMAAVKAMEEAIRREERKLEALREAMRWRLAIGYIEPIGPIEPPYPIHPPEPPRTIVIPPPGVTPCRVREKAVA